LKLHTVDEFNNRTKHKIYTGKTFTPGIVGEPILQSVSPTLTFGILWHVVFVCAMRYWQLPGWSS